MTSSCTRMRPSTGCTSPSCSSTRFATASGSTTPPSSSSSTRPTSSEKRSSTQASTSASPTTRAAATSKRPSTTSPPSLPASTETPRKRSMLIPPRPPTPTMSNSSLRQFERLSCVNLSLVQASCKFLLSSSLFLCSQFQKNNKNSQPSFT